MPKVSLTFNLPDERIEYLCAMHGEDWKLIVYDLAMFLRNALKYGHTFKTADEAFEAAKAALWERCKTSNLDPWGDE